MASTVTRHSGEVRHRHQAQAPRHPAGPGPARDRHQQHPAGPPGDPRHDRPGPASRPGRGRPGAGIGRGGFDESSRLKPPPGSTRARRRVGRGIAGKGGKTAGRGTKGQGARDNVKPGFEGGQLPLKQRIPKLKGFKNPFRVEYNVINLDTLEGFESTTVSPETLRAAGLVHKHGLVKVLGPG